MSSGSLIGLIIGLVGLILLSAFFSCAETAMMSLNRYRLRHLAKRGHRQARRVQKMLERPDRLLSVILICNTFANILASSLATIIAVHLLGDLGVAIATILMTLGVLIFAEIAPKTVAALYPQSIAFAVSLPLALLQKILYPLVLAANFLVVGLLRGCRIKVADRIVVDQLSSEELRTVVHEAAGAIPEQHQDMLLGILDLSNLTVADSMQPRSKIVGIDLNDKWELILQRLMHSKHTYLPLYFDTIDNVQGTLHLKDVIKLLVDNKLTKQMLIEVATEPYFVPEGTSLNLQLSKFRQGPPHHALVVDEYGGIVGLITLEDILEEIVGEFTLNMATNNKAVAIQKDGSVIAKGGISTRQLNKSLSWQFPTNGPKTLSGVIIEYLEMIPANNICLIVEGYRIEVMQIRGNKVRLARILPPAKKQQK